MKHPVSEIAFLEYPAGKIEVLLATKLFSIPRRCSMDVNNLGSYYKS